MSKDILFNPETWFSPNTYDKNFSDPIDGPGVYVITNSIIDFIKGTKDIQILYIGSSQNLKQRYSKHEVLRVLREMYDFCQFFFVPEDNYKEVERSLIQHYQPKFNTQWLKGS